MNKMPPHGKSVQYLRNESHRYDTYVSINVLI